MTTKLEFYKSMMQHAIGKGYMIGISTKHLELSVKPIEYMNGYVSCEGVNMIFDPLEEEIKSTGKKLQGGYYFREVILIDGTTYRVWE